MCQVESSSSSSSSSSIEVTSSIAIRLAQVVVNLCSKQNKKVLCVSPFYGRNVNINLLDYGERLGTYMSCSETSYHVACVLLERLFLKDSSYFCERAAHKLLFASVLVGLKWTEDFFYDNYYYANIGGLALKETNYLESEFLKALDFGTFVNEQDFFRAKMTLANPSLVMINLFVESNQNCSYSLNISEKPISSSTNDLEDDENCNDMTAFSVAEFVVG
eukprot:c1869_g1_i1.p1 GENE.c1869_g1_i1~~c1869_g1_i1.p1  ORF type:complete len:219 (+),score=82.49 c1869_g1_i1:83-739(+)